MRPPPVAAPSAAWADSAFALAFVSGDNNGCLCQSPQPPGDPLTVVAFLDAYPGRVLIAADSAGRREVITQLLGAHGRTPRAVAGWQAFASGDARLAITPRDIRSAHERVAVSVEALRRDWQRPHRLDELATAAGV